MATFKSAAVEDDISRGRLAELLNEDLAREYQAIIGYVIYSQVLKGAEYMDIAGQSKLRRSGAAHARTSETPTSGASALNL